MLAAFEFFVANRYLRAKRKQAVVSLVTGISVAGVTAGVMALVIALAINNGFRSTLQRNLLGATAHVNILEKEPGAGIENWRELVRKSAAIPHVTGAAPTLYGQVFFSGPMQSKGAILKGIDPASELQVSDTLRRLKQGSLDDLKRLHKGLPGVILGSKLAQETGMLPGSVVRVISPQGELTPFGPRPSYHDFRVVGIFESGFYDFDANWAFAALPAVQRTLSLEDVVNAVEIRLDDLYRAPEVASEAARVAGPRFAATNWMEQNRQILGALRMERVVTVVTIGLIQLVAALNILVALILMVMERYRDIAVLLSLGARREQIRRIFIAQGLLIGASGTALGLAAGYAICYLADRNQWIRLDEQVYALSYVPFQPVWYDGIWIAAAALLISVLATIYPAMKATNISPVEVLRYE